MHFILAKADADASIFAQKQTIFASFRRKIFDLWVIFGIFYLIIADISLKITIIVNLDLCLTTFYFSFSDDETFYSLSLCEEDTDVEKVSKAQNYTFTVYRYSLEISENIFNKNR